MSKATDYVRKWIKEQELKAQTKKAESALFGETKKAPEPELIISAEDQERIDREVNRRFTRELYRDGLHAIKSEEEIRRQVIELFKIGEL
jgi:hypothetical protein